MDMKQILVRLKNIFNVKRNEDICNILGISPPTLSKKIKDNTVPASEILKALEHTDHDLRIIFYGVNNKVSCECVPNIQFFNDENNTSSQGTLICSSNFDNVYIDPIFLPEACIGNIAAFHIRHESMGDTLKKGDIIFIDRNNRSVIDGKIHIVDMNGSVVIKRIFKMTDHILVKSDDPSYPVEEVQEKDIIILGTVIYKRTSL